MARRPHPYFGRINRLEAGRIEAPRDSRARAPKMTPGDQQGVLWTAFRDAGEPA